MTPRVSALIVTYNYGRFIARAIESVFAQTFQDLEVIVVDDGSADETADVLRQFGDRIRVIRQERQGVSRARNIAIEASRGEFVGFLDGDDWWQPTKIARQVELLDRRPELGCVGCGSELRTPDGRVQPLPGILNHGATRPDTLRRIALRRFRINGSTSGILMRRSLLNRIGGFDEELGAAEDLDLWMRIAAATDVDNIPDVLLSVDRHGTGTFRDATFVEAQQWKVYHRAVSRWPDVLTRGDRRRMRAMIFADHARESRDPLAVLGYYARSLAEWPFNSRCLREALIAWVRLPLGFFAGSAS